MSSTFNGQGIFNSGPHRFSTGPQGESMVSNFVIGALPPNGTTAQGPRELDVIVTGRLVAPSESSLWMLRNAVAAQLTHPPTAASLVDHFGHTWTGLSFIEYKEEDQTDRGRVTSVAYRAVFRKIAT